MELGVLGVVEAVHEGRKLALGGRQQRALLAVLAVHKGEPVSTDEIVEALWAGTPPPTATTIVQAYVSRLRKVLPPGTLATEAGGYAIRAVDVDADRFEKLVARARAEPPERTASTLDAALGLWRGPAYADFRYDDFAQPEIARLEELRLTALEERIEVALALGRHAEVVGELEVLVREHPLRERLRRQLMLALYRSGRQAEALETYRAARRTLVEELGIEPGPALQELERAILRQDPVLAGEAPAPDARRRRRVRAAALAVTSLAAAAIAVAAFALGGGDESDLRPIAFDRCSPIHYDAAGRPQFLIAADMPLQRGILATTSPMVDAMTLALDRRGYRAGRYRIGLQVCDDAEPGSVFNWELCRANAEAYVDNPSVIGVVGPFSSRCAMIQIPILNRALGGSIAIVSPSNTYVGLTRSGPAAAPGEPAVYYPTGKRNYARVLPADDVQAAGNAIVAARLGVSRAFVLTDESHGGGALAGDFVRAAPRLRIAVVGSVASWYTWAHNYTGLAERIAAARADGVFFGGASGPDTVRLLTELRARLGPAVQFIASEGFDPRTAALAGAAADGMILSEPGVPVDRLSGEGKQFVASYRREFGAEPTRHAVNAAQAVDVLLDAIARSDGTRASVARNLFTTRISNGILGSFWITPAGDTTLNTVAIYRIVGGELRTFDTVEVPDGLVTQD